MKYAKHRSVLTLGLFAASLSFNLLALVQTCGPFDIVASTIDNGGGASTGRAFNLSGTIGQPDAAPTLSSGDGRFAIEPGFWHRITLMQTPGTPLLKIRLNRYGQAVISWPLNVIGFTLEETTALGTGVWTATAQPIVDTPMEHTVTVPAAGVIKCYRQKSNL